MAHLHLLVKYYFLCGLLQSNIVQRKIILKIYKSFMKTLRLFYKSKLYVLGLKKIIKK